MDERCKKSKLDKRQGVLEGMVKAFLMKHNLNRDQIPEQSPHFLPLRNKIQKKNLSLEEYQN